MFDFIQKLPAKLDERGLIWKWNHKMPSLFIVRMMCKSTYFPLYLLSNKQSDPSVSSHIVLGDDRGDKDLKLASVPRGYQKYRRGILLKAPLIQHLASNLKLKSNIPPQSLQSEFHPDQSFRNWESLKDSSIYYSLNYRSIILGGYANK